MLQERKVYLCDHRRNISCPKTSCMYNPEAYPRSCFKTFDEKYAQRNEDGTPVIAEVIESKGEYEGL